MMTSRLGLLLPLLFGSASAWAVDGFQDAKWGMSPDEVRAIAPENACKAKLKTIQGFDALSCKQPAGASKPPRFPTSFATTSWSR